VAKSKNVFDKVPKDIIDTTFESAAKFMILLMQGYNTRLTANERLNVASEFINILENTYQYRLSAKGRELMVTQIMARLVSLGY